MLEAGVGSTPILGTLSDFAHLAYAAATGRSFWGEPMAEEELLVFGALTLLSLGLSSASRIRALYRVTRSRPKLAIVLDEDFLASMDDRIEPRVREAVETLSGQQRRQIRQVIDQYAAGKGSARAVTKGVGEAVGARVGDPSPTSSALSVSLQPRYSAI